MNANQIRIKIDNGYIIAERNPTPNYDGVSVLFETNQGDLFDLVFIESKKENNYSIYRSIDQNPITLTSEEKIELKSILYSALDMFSEYHPDLEPKENDDLETLIEGYCYWGDEYNEGYIRELDEQREEDNRLVQYLAYEFKKYRGEI